MSKILNPEYNYSYVFFFEKKCSDPAYAEQKRIWIHDNWHRSFYYAIAYILIIFTLQSYMKNREKYRLNRALIAWNLVLSLFSLFGAVRSWPHFIYTLKTGGIEYSVCVRDFDSGVSGCWSWFFILSKVPELVDTLFIVFRKQKLIFLHWYHHATVLVYCWYATSDIASSGRWFMVMNYTIHSVMYGYYAFKALRFNIPKWINIMITTGQISQMIIGIFVNTLAYRRKNRGEHCDVTYENIYWSFFMYFTYFLLFFHFFIKTYLSRGSKKAQSKLTDNVIHKKKA